MAKLSLKLIINLIFEKKNDVMVFFHISLTMYLLENKVGVKQYIIQVHVLKITIDVLIGQVSLQLLFYHQDQFSVQRLQKE